MEPFPKRQRLYAQIEREFPRSFGSQETYFDTAAHDDFITDEDEFVGEEDDQGVEEVEREEEGEEEPNYDDDSLFQEKRARLDHKLKSTFEAIFEKYGKDFEGIGDEIDLATGEIVVNNGHLLRMQDEMDPGDANRAQIFQTESTDELDEEQIMSPGETDFDDDGDDNGEEIETTSDDDMVEDDLILRGFARAKRLMQASPELGTMRGATLRDPYHEKNTESSSKRTTLPPESEILSQFGPLIGPQILEYISRQSKPDDSHIEPAWRVPDIPLSRLTNHSGTKKITLPSEMERSPSPEAAGSIWAPIKTRVRRKSSGKEKEKLLRGTLATNSDNVGSPGASRSRAPNFTKVDDDILEKFVTRGRREGITLTQIFRDLEARHPHRSWHTWRDRYFRKFTYLSKANASEESDLNSETSVYTDPKATRIRGRMGNVDYEPPQAPEFERPTRARKPAQRDSRIISWQDAVDALDPYEHAEILEDAKMLNLTPKQPDKQLRNTHRLVQESQDDPSRQKQSNTNIPAPQSQQGTSKSQPIKGTPEFENPKIPAVPCPHADCTMNSKIKYKLQPRNDEDVSEMNLHLFTTHHTTPFPCSEFDCPRSGENGYFMQADLVKHVRYAHPGVGPLHRLRGRVAPEILDPKNLRPMTQNKSPDAVENQNMSRFRDSDFMSSTKGFTPRLMSSTEFSTSNFDPDRTLTPRVRNQDYVATATPMTSISSLKVNHSPNTTSPAREISDSQEWPTSDIHADDESVGVMKDLSGLGIYISEDHRALHATTEIPSRRVSSLDSRMASGEKESNLLPTPATSTVYPQEIRQPWLADFQRVEELRETNTVSVMKHTEPITTTEVLLDLTPHHAADKYLIKPPIASMNGHRSDSEMISSEEPEAMNPSGQITTLHDNSDEDDLQTSGNLPEPLEVRQEGTSSSEHPVVVSPKQARPVLPKNTTQTPMLARQQPETPNPIESMVLNYTVPLSNTIKSITKSEPKPIPEKPQTLHPSLLPKSLVQTPANPKPRKSILRKLIRSGEIDELSLCDDDIILISSRSKANFKLNEKIRIKREDSANLTPISSLAATKKRKLDMFQGGDEIDELGLDENISPTSQSTRVKTEGEDLILSSIPTETNKEAPAQGESLAPVTLYKDATIATSETPLLDLTPSGRNQRRTNGPNEIADSAEVSSPSMPSNQGRETISRSSSPLDGLLTPVKKKGWDSNLKANKTVIAIRTPGGTVRRCGEGGFKCRKSFCFRCGSNAAASTMD